MGIPRFAYRMKDYARTEVIGSKNVQDSHQQGCIPLAVIDGPSLSHSIFHSWKKRQGDCRGLIPTYDYAQIGQNAIAWLDALSSYGFEIEGVYFDGALPHHKKRIREARMQRYADKLAGFKRTHHAICKSMRSIAVDTLSDSNQRRLEVAQKDLPPPPFLVFVVVEALLRSQYANRTWVVPGEADSFCAAATASISLNDVSRPVTIFTNDSDLLIYPLGAQTKVVMVDSIDKSNRDHVEVLTARQFWPFGLVQMGPISFPDLIRPAFAMQQPYVTFMEALDESQHIVESEEYEHFAGSYSIQEPGLQLESLRELRKAGMEELQIDSRVVELIRLAMDEAYHLARAKGKFSSDVDGSQRDNSEAKIEILKEQGLRDLARLPVPEGCEPSSICEDEATLLMPQRDQNGGFDLSISEDALCDKNWKQGYPEAQVVLLELDMYLPVLLDDPSRASAWKVGCLFRYAAEALVLYSCGIDGSIVEHRKASHGVAVGSLKGSFARLLPQRAIAWTRYIERERRDKPHLSELDRWRLVVVQLMLADMTREGNALPPSEEIASVLMAEPPITWNLVHLKAQYEAEYYSLRMLKQVLSHMKLVVVSISWLGELLEQINDLPGIAEFFCAEAPEAPEVARIGWQTLLDEVLSYMERETPQTPEQKKATVARAPITTCAQPMVRNSNIFAMLPEE